MEQDNLLPYNPHPISYVIVGKVLTTYILFNVLTNVMRNGYLILKGRLTVATRHVSYKFYHHQVADFRQPLDLFQVYQAT